MSKETGTLEELDVKPGDVVAWHRSAGSEWQDKHFAGIDDWVVREDGGVFSESADDGFGSKCPHKFRIISRESDAPKLWRDMTDEEKEGIPADTLNDPTNPLQIPWGEWTREAKGAVLLASHERKVVEYCSISGVWGLPASGSPALHDVNTYRVKPEPEPVRETVGLYAGLDRKRHPLPIGTIVLEDGEPDLASIKMEEI